MPAFPTLEWFESLNKAVNEDLEYRQNGTCDAVIGIRVADKPEEIWNVSFEAFEVTGVRKIGEPDLPALDFYLELPYEGWKEMLQNIKENGRADRSHTINTLDLSTPGGFARGHDQFRKDLFFRYNQSFQSYFDASSKLDTTYPD